MRFSRLANAVIVAVAALAAGCGPSDQSTGAKKETPATPPAAAAPDTPAPSQPASDKITARAQLSRVLAEAAKWQADAELFGVFTSFAEGPATAFWLYDFQSRATKTCMRLRAFANGKLDTAEASQDCRIRKPVPREFVDSPKAMASSVAAGMKTGESVEFSLRFLKDQALAAPRACWVISSDSDSESGVTRAWCVDPATGAFVTRLSGYGGPVFE
jgi:hypothetical protein